MCRVDVLQLIWPDSLLIVLLFPSPESIAYLKNQPLLCSCFFSSFICCCSCFSKKTKKVHCCGLENGAEIVFWDDVQDALRFALDSRLSFLFFGFYLSKLIDYQSPLSLPNDIFIFSSLRINEYGNGILDFHRKSLMSLGLHGLLCLDGSPLNSQHAMVLPHLDQRVRRRQWQGGWEFRTILPVVRWFWSVLPWNAFSKGIICLIISSCIVLV